MGQLFNAYVAAAAQGGLPSAQRVLALAYAACGITAGSSWTTPNGAFTVTLTDPPRALPSHGDGVTILATVYVAITRNSDGVDVTPALLNPIQFQLVPQHFMVPDPTGDVSLSGIQWRDDAAALRQTLIANIKGAIKSAAGIG